MFPVGRVAAGKQLKEWGSAEVKGDCNIPVCQVSPFGGHLGNTPLVSCLENRYATMQVTYKPYLLKFKMTNIFFKKTVG